MTFSAPDIASWTARLLSVGAAGFVLMFAVGDEGVRFNALRARESVLLLLMAAGIVANLAAWRWQVQGAVLALVALACIAGYERTSTGRLPGIWFFALLGLPACIHVLAWAMR